MSKLIEVITRHVRTAEASDPVVRTRIDGALDVLAPARVMALPRDEQVAWLIGSTQLEDLRAIIEPAAPK